MKNLAIYACNQIVNQTINKMGGKTAKTALLRLVSFKLRFLNFLLK